MKIVLGLGNPGPRYARTRHNAGFMVIERFAGEIGARFRSEADVADLAPGRSGGEDVVVARPTTWMNRSGIAASLLARRYDAGPGDFILVYDDVALPLGRLRLRAGGSSGGHRGAQSVIDLLNSEQIPRLRLGVLGERGEADLADYVLEEFELSERPVLEEMINRAVGALALALERGVGYAASRYNAVEQTDTDRAG